MIVQFQACQEHAPSDEVEHVPLDRAATLAQISHPEIRVSPDDGDGDNGRDEASQALIIDPEFERLLSTLTHDEAAGLRASLQQNGCMLPLVVWDGILLDGHNRYRLCRELGIGFQIKTISLPDRKSAFNWIIDNQLSRRNVTPEMASYLRGMRYLEEKQPEGGDRKSLGQNVPVERTSAKIASHFGVDEKTIRRDAEYAKAVDKAPEATRKAILSGKSSATKKQIVEAARANDFSMVTKPKPPKKPSTKKDTRSKEAGQSKNESYAEEVATGLRAVMREAKVYGYSAFAKLLDQKTRDLLVVELNALLNEMQRVNPV